MDEPKRGRISHLARKIQQLRALEARVERLEQDAQEARRLSRRIAELTDLVQELLVPAASRDDARLRELLERYERELGSPALEGANQEIQEQR